MLTKNSVVWAEMKLWLPISPDRKDKRSNRDSKPTAPSSLKPDTRNTRYVHRVDLHKNSLLEAWLRNITAKSQLYRRFQRTTSDGVPLIQKFPRMYLPRKMGCQKTHRKDIFFRWTKRQARKFSAEFTFFFCQLSFVESQIFTVQAIRRQYSLK